MSVEYYKYKIAKYQAKLEAMMGAGGVDKLDSIKAEMRENNPEKASRFKGAEGVTPKTLLELTAVTGSVMYLKKLVTMYRKYLVAADLIRIANESLEDPMLTQYINAVKKLTASNAS